MARFLMKAELFAIRHVPTGRYMPQLDRRGYTVLDVDQFTTKPRLFWSRGGAHKALRCWLRGPHSKSGQSQNPFTGEWDVEDGGIPVDDTPPVDRVPADMEVVQFTLTED